MQKEEVVKQNSLKAWVLASRPKTLAAAAVPVMIGVAYGSNWFFDGHRPIPEPDDWYSRSLIINGIISSVCFLFAMVMQIDANFINDYFDCVRGNDDETRLGPKRACAMGWVSLRAMRWAIGITTALACLIGLPVALACIYSGDWGFISMGIACVVFCFLYTTCLSYMGLGDLLVLVFFGLVPVYGTYYLFSWDASNIDVYLLGISTGLVIDTLLIINNYRDIDNDRKAGKRTLAVIFGRKAMEWVYLLIFVPAIFLNIYVMNNISGEFSARVLPVVSALYIVLFAMHFQTWRKMKKIGKGRELNNVLAMTARNIFVYGILSTIGIIFAWNCY